MHDVEWIHVQLGPFGELSFSQHPTTVLDPNQVCHQRLGLGLVMVLAEIRKMKVLVPAMYQYTGSLYSFY